MSPHLAFGEISPAACWRAVTDAAKGKGASDQSIETFLKLAWREFSYSLLFHFPKLPEQPLRQEFETFGWRGNSAQLKAWQAGKTGYPIVDAGMRELWATGYMHNRARMITASFLIKHLLISWTTGEAWFWDTLVDADLSNNAASWQWVAVVAQMRPPISVSSIPYCRARSLTRMATMYGAGFLNSRACPLTQYMRRGPPMPRH